MKFPRKSRDERSEGPRIQVDSERIRWVFQPLLAEDQPLPLRSGGDGGTTVLIEALMEAHGLERAEAEKFTLLEVQARLAETYVRIGIERMKTRAYAEGRSDLTTPLGVLELDHVFGLSSDEAGR